MKLNRPSVRPLATASAEPLSQPETTPTGANAGIGGGGAAGKVAGALPDAGTVKKRGRTTGARGGTSTPSSPEGCFLAATPAQAEALRQTYLRSKEVGLARAPEGKISRVSAEHLAVNLEGADEATIGRLLARGTDELTQFYYFTSGAGLWSRGGGQVKATVPLNLRRLVSTGDRAELDYASDIVNAKSPADVLFMAQENVPFGSSAETAAGKIVEKAKRRIEDILAPARADEVGLTPLAMKLVNVALACRRAGTYVPFDVWTSEQTHGLIREYVEIFRETHARRDFHPDRKVQRTILDALGYYFDQAAARGDTHLFGMQIGYHALDPETGLMLPDTARIGEGAGRAKAYLDASGRTKGLADAGKTTWVFENVEVLTDLPLLLGAHAEAGKDVSVVLVPQRKGYAGGNPFLVEKPDGWTNLELHEQSALPAELAVGHAYFNSNTIFQPLSASAPTELGFEVKNNGTQVRAKQNAGDITKELPTAGIGGRIGHEYENLKTYRELADNGPALIDLWLAVWAREAAQAPRRR